MAIDLVDTSEVQALVRDLKKLRGGAGLRLSKIPELRAIMSLPVVREADAVHDRASVAQQVILDAISSFPDDDERLYAEAMMGTGRIVGRYLKMRILALSGNPETIRDRMDRLIVELAYRVLAAGYEAPVPDQADEDAPSLMPEILGHPRDVLAWLSLGAASETTVALTVFLVRIRDLGSIIFLEVADATGSIQTVCRKEHLLEYWDEVKRLKVGDHIQIKGHPEQFGRDDTPSVIAEAVVLLPRDERLRHETQPLTSGDRRLGMSVMVPRLRHVMTAYLRAKTFDELDAPIIARQDSLPMEGGVLVALPGWGSHRSLLPSPMPFLVEAVLSGHYRVFTFSRAITTATVSDLFPESAILSLCVLRPEKDEMRQLLTNLLLALSNTLYTRPYRTELVDRIDDKAVFPITDVSNVVEQITFRRANSSHPSSHRAVIASLPGERDVAIESEVTMFETLRLGCLTLYLERIATYCS